MVILETALAIPLLVLVALSALFVARVAVDELAVVGAARDAALAVARGEPAATAGDEIRRRLPGAEVYVTGDAGTVTVTVRRATSTVPGLGQVAVRHEAVAVSAREPG